MEALSSPCLPEVFQDFAWAPAISMTFVLLIFLVELVAHRSGAAYMKRRGLKQYTQSESSATVASSFTALSRPEAKEEGDVPRSETDHAQRLIGRDPISKSRSREENEREATEIDEGAMTQIVTVAILEFGVVVHSFTVSSVPFASSFLLILSY